MQAPRIQKHRPALPNISRGPHIKHPKTDLFTTFLVVTLSSSFLATAQAKPNLWFHYESAALVAEGQFVNDPKNPKSGLDVEIIARQNALQSISKQIDAHCSDAILNLSSSWEQGVKSVRSEIYADGTFKIVLVAYLKDIFENYSSLKNSKNAMTKNNNQEQIVFSLPQISFESTKCGALQLAKPGTTDVLTVFPFALSPSESKSLRSVSLVQKEGGVLMVANEADAAVLTDYVSSISSTNKPIALPIK